MVGLAWRPAAPLLVAALLAASVPATPAGADAAATDDEVVVAVLDSGIYAQHETFEPGQVVAWYDFTLEGGPEEPQVMWDPRVEPYDDDGHGTAVAALVGGVGGGQTASRAPGVALAIAKVQAGGATYATDLAGAIRWAVDVVGADVISISQWWSNPNIGSATVVLEAIREARGAGALVAVLAGNSQLPSYLHAPATSRDALVVGGAWASPAAFYGVAPLPEGTPTSPFSCLEPEVTAPFFVWTASTECSTCYEWQAGGGTSFSTPLVAGMAASLIQGALSAGLPQPSPARLEHVLKWAARETPAPPQAEGYGYLGQPELGLAHEHLVSGTTPNQDDPLKWASALWVEGVQPAARALGAGDLI